MVKETLYRFGPFELNPVERVLRRSGVVVQVTPKALATLNLLVAAGGRVLSKEDLLRELWPDSFVEDGNLTQHISALRKIFAPDFPTSSPIETIARVGYRFSAPVEEVETQTTPVTPLETTQTALILPQNQAWKWVLPAIVLLALAFLFRHDIRAKLGPHTPQITLTRFTTKATEDRVTAAAISPDGHLMAYADADGVVLQAIDDPAAHALRSPSMRKINHLAWFPNGLHLAMSGIAADSGHSQVWILSVVGDAPALFRDDAALAVPSPDGTQVAFTNGTASDVWVSGPAGESAHRLFTGLPNDIFAAVLWAKNSKTVLLERQTQVAQRSLFPAGSQEAIHGFKATYLGLDAATGRQTTSISGMRFEDACLLKDDLLFFSRTEPTSDFNGADTLWTVPIDPSTGAFTAEPQKIKDVAEYRIASLSVAANGEIAAILNQSWPQVYVGNLHGSPPTLDAVKRLSFDAGIAYPHSWTADSQSVLSEAYHGGHYQIYTQQIDRHDPEAIATTTEIQSRPRLSADHRWILFLSKPSKPAPYALYRVSVQGGSPILVMNGPVSDFRCPAAGKTCILLTSHGHQEVFSAFDPITGQGPELFRTPPASPEVLDWDISPDGYTLAIVPAHSQNPEIQTVPLASKNLQHIPVDIATPIAALNWAADGKGWFISTPSPPATELLYIDLHGKSTPIRKTIGGTWAVPSPDGKKLAFVDQNIDSNVWFLHPSD